ncbi:MAG: hypothetical protein KDN05_11840, partial [Verrucomicrobiae bacterium]|nr:hypothetical protein [Verrucomicrobiae bacterium]
SLLCDLFGWSRSIARRALKNLENEGLVRECGKAGRGIKSTRIWEVIGYQEWFRDPESRDYVVIARKLLDPGRKEFRADGIMIHVWLSLLFKARFIADEDGLVARGEWHEKPCEIAGELGISEEQVVFALSCLENQKRIFRWRDEAWGLNLVRVIHFDRYQRQVPWSKVPGECTSMGRKGRKTEKNGRTIPCP